MDHERHKRKPSLESIQTSDFGVLLRSYGCSSPPILLDFDSDVSAVKVLKRIADDLMATRSTESNYTDVSMRSEFFNPITHHSPPSRLDFSFSEKNHDVTYVEEWIKSLDDQPDDLIGPDIDPVGDHDVLWVDFDSDVSAVEVLKRIADDLRRAEREALLYMLRLLDFDVSAVEKWIKLLDDLMATGSLESIDSDVSLKSDWSAEEQIDFKDRVFLRPDFSSSEEHDVSDDEDWVKSSDHHRSDFSSSEKKHVVADDEDWVKSPDDLMATGSLESNDSGVSLKSDRSKGGGIDFKDRVSLSRPDFSSSEEEDVSDDEDWVKSSDSQREDDILPYMYPWSDDCDWMELADNLGGHEPGVVV